MLKTLTGSRAMCCGYLDPAFLALLKGAQCIPTGTTLHGARGVSELEPDARGPRCGSDRVQDRSRSPPGGAWD